MYLTPWKLVSLENSDTFGFESISIKCNQPAYDTGLLHHFHCHLRRLYGWDILWILIFARVSMDWHISHVFMVHTENSFFVSHFMPIDSYQHQRSSHFIFDFLKLNLCQYVFVSTFSSVDVNKYYFPFWHMYASGRCIWFYQLVLDCIQGHFVYVKHVIIVFIEHNIFSKTSNVYASLDLDLSLV